MKTRLREERGVTFVELRGTINFEETENFKKEIYPLLKKKKRKYIFICNDLRFVGSSNMRNFLITLNSLVEGNGKPKFCGLPKEFERILDALIDDDFEIFESVELAKKSFRIKPRRQMTH